MILRWSRAEFFFRYANIFFGNESLIISLQSESKQFSSFRNSLSLSLFFRVHCFITISEWKLRKQFYLYNTIVFTILLSSSLFFLGVISVIFWSSLEIFSKLLWKFRENLTETFFIILLRDFKKIKKYKISKGSNP